MEQYRTEEEQVEALRRWWDENGRSTIAAVIIALSLGFGWQGWKDYSQGQREAASDAYQAMLQQLGFGTDSGKQEARKVGEHLKTDFKNTTYAQFAALHLARLAVELGDMTTAEAELRWVLARADAGGDIAQVAQLRLARVLAAKGNGDQGLAILEQTDPGAYGASYAAARGDILMQLGREDEAREAYEQARMLVAAGQVPVNLAVLDQKLQSLNPVPAREVAPADEAPAPAEEPVAEE